MLDLLTWNEPDMHMCEITATSTAIPGQFVMLKLNWSGDGGWKVRKCFVFVKLMLVLLQLGIVLVFWNWDYMYIHMYSRNKKAL